MVDRITLAMPLVESDGTSFQPDRSHDLGHKWDYRRILVARWMYEYGTADWWRAELLCGLIVRDISFFSILAPLKVRIMIRE